ncbi:10787_t:CDS:2 [Funneliformis caledonium]|uniref:10787_t:CDS:1 n=1 Tax=Funneliformis caledonium TaxID=1117310 RepID=A0A9N9BRU5_9GLOM|nr:10787_t:CDS:2 [Funneliformis caledonium]
MSTNNILNIVNSLANETNALNEGELVYLFEYLTDNDTKKSDVKKFLIFCSNNNAKLSYLRVILNKPETGLAYYYCEQEMKYSQEKRGITFGRIKTSYELFELIKSIIPLKEEEQELSDDFDLEKQLMSLVKNLTTKAEYLSDREYNIYTGFKNLEKYPPGRPTSINCIIILKLMKSAFISYSMTGRPIITFATLSESRMFFVKVKIRKKKQLEITITFLKILKDLPSCYHMLRAVAEWEKTENAPKGFCLICYPPNMVGSDISIAFFFLRAEDDMQLDEE